MEKAFRGLIRTVRRSPNLFAFAGGLFLAFGTPFWFDSIFAALYRAEADAANGHTVSPSFVPLNGLYDPVVRSGIAVAVMFTIIGIGVLVMLLALARRFSRWQLRTQS